MKQVKDFSDRRNKAWCIHCGQTLSSVQTSADHVPTKSLLSEPKPDNLPVVIICRECNTGFSADEQYAVAFIGAVLAGSTDPRWQTLDSARGTLAHSPSLRQKIDACRSEYADMDGVTRTLWTPDAKRIESVILKNARGHAYFELGEPLMHAPSAIYFLPFEAMQPTQRDAFESSIPDSELAGWSEVGSRLLTRMTEGQDFADGWVIVQPGRYRYSVRQNGGITVRSVWSEYLAIEVIWDD